MRIQRTPVKRKTSGGCRVGKGVTELVESLGYRIRAAAPGRCSVVASDGALVLDNVTATDIWNWLRRGGLSRGGAREKPKGQKLGGWRRSMLAVLMVAHEEGSRKGAHFGTKKDKQTLRELVKLGLARVVSQTKGGPEGVEMYALPTKAGVVAYETGVIPRAKPKPKTKPKKKAKTKPAKRKKAPKRKKPRKRKGRS